jgi:DNA-binding NtrC family response regulator
MTPQRPNKVLLVEDDENMKYIWEAVMKKIAPQVELIWAQSSFQAILMVHESRQKNLPFELTICDLLLLNHSSGFDVWENYNESDGKFVMTSMISQQDFHELYKHSGPLPEFVPKTLSVIELCQIIQNVLK